MLRLLHPNSWEILYADCQLKASRLPDCWEASRRERTSVDELVADTMNFRGQVLVKKARSTVADDDISIGEWASIRIGPSVDFLKVPVAEAAALVRIPDSSRTSREVRKVPKGLNRSRGRGLRRAAVPIRG